jgi:hypothetical protein
MVMDAISDQGMFVVIAPMKRAAPSLVTVSATLPARVCPHGRIRLKIPPKD